MTFPAALAVAGLALSAALVVAAAPASAHVELIEADPAPDARTPSGTTQIVLRFAALDVTAAVVVAVRGPDGRDLVSGTPEVSARNSTVVVPVTPLRPGDHRVEWEAVSDDGDGAEQGGFAFVVAEPRDDTASTVALWLVVFGAPASVWAWIRWRRRRVGGATAEREPGARR